MAKRNTTTTTDSAPNRAAKRATKGAAKRATKRAAKRTDSAPAPTTTDSAPAPAPAPTAPIAAPANADSAPAPDSAPTGPLQYVNCIAPGTWGRRAPNAATGAGKTQAIVKIAAMRACHGLTKQQGVAFWQKHKVPGKFMRTLAWCTGPKINGPWVALQTTPPTGPVGQSWPVNVVAGATILRHANGMPNMALAPTTESAPST